MAIHCNRRSVQTCTPHTSFFSCTVRMLNDVYHTTLAQVSARTRHSILVPSMVSGWLFSRPFSVPRFVPFRVSLLHLALLFPLLPVLCPEPLLPCGRRQLQTLPAPPPIEESCSLAEFTPPT